MTVRRGRLSRHQVADLPVPQREIDLQRQLVGKGGLATIYGWEHIHFRPAMTKHGWRTAGSGTMASGWPDLVLIRPRDRRLIFAELKRDGAKISDDQERVLEVLRSVTWPACRCDGPLGGIMFGAQQTDDGKLHDSGCPAAGGAFPGLAPKIEVYVWRPADFDEIVRVLR